MKACGKCGGTEFYIYASGRRRCKECQRERMRDYYKTDKYREMNRVRHKQVKRPDRSRPAIPIAVFNEMKKAQRGRCAICRRTSKRELHIDHCHKTGKVRGLLCSACNPALGAFKDDPKLLMAAVRYLKEAA